MRPIPRLALSDNINWDTKTLLKQMSESRKLRRLQCHVSWLSHQVFLTDAVSGAMWQSLGDPLGQWDPESLNDGLTSLFVRYHWFSKYLVINNIAFEMVLFIFIYSSQLYLWVHNIVTYWMLTCVSHQKLYSSPFFEQVHHISYKLFLKTPNFLRSVLNRGNT